MYLLLLKLILFSVPSNYHYLDNNLILRALVDFLIDAGKLGKKKMDDKLVLLYFEVFLKIFSDING